MNNTHFMNLKF